MTAVRTALPLTLGCLISMVTLARPVSYAGGWTVIEESDRQSSSALVHYTPYARTDGMCPSSSQPEWHVAWKESYMKWGKQVGRS